MNKGKSRKPRTGKKEKRGPGRPKQKAAPGFSASFEEYALKRGISRSTISKAAKRDPNGVPIINKEAGGRRDSDMDAWLEKLNVIPRSKSAEQSEEEKEVRLRRAKLALAREEFEFEQMKERMVPISQVDLLFTRTLSAFKAAVLALPARINERLEGLDYNDRMLVFNEEIPILLKTLAKPDYLQPIGEDDGELD